MKKRPEGLDAAPLRDDSVPQPAIRESVDGGCGGGGVPVEPSHDDAPIGPADEQVTGAGVAGERTAEREVSYVGPDFRPAGSGEVALGDFTTDRGVLRLLPLAVLIGVLAAGVALGLLDMIGFITQAVYYHRLGTQLLSPGGSRLGAASIAIPVAGGLAVGLVARFGSEQIRGHGIPEAMERILVNGSRVQPRLALLKPISSAISIGTGGPFGAEGPIILTGGAVGSIVGQLLRLTAAERRALLVAGASAGMSAVFGTPVAATLFGVELLVFELKPRSMVLIGTASAVADAIRIAMAHGHLLKGQPLFPLAGHPAVGGLALLGAAVVGVLGGLLAFVMTHAVYRSEDAFLALGKRLHWMWWPMIGGLVIGLGGLLDRRALGVGYGTIHAELLGRLGIGALLLLLAVKLVIWSVGLGSGTSGGILAPVLMLGAAIGAAVGHVLPGGSISLWALVGMAAALSGVTRSPFTAIVFALELTRDADSLLGLLMASTVAHLVSVLVLKRSILTEKVARRGFHVTREYAVDPLEAVFVREVMQTEVVSVDEESPLAALLDSLDHGSQRTRQRLYPVLEPSGTLAGVIPLSVARLANNKKATAAEVMKTSVLVAHPDDTLRSVAHVMAEHRVEVLPVVSRGGRQQLVGMVSLFDLLQGRQRLLEEERHAERVLRLRWVTRSRRGASGKDGARPAGQSDALAAGAQPTALEEG
jgi:H+/Cl- antiporter ClcA